MVELRDVFITGTGAFLPGPPVANDRMEDHLGRIGGRDSVIAIYQVFDTADDETSRINSFPLVTF